MECFSCPHSRWLLGPQRGISMLFLCSPLELPMVQMAKHMHRSEGTNQWLLGSFAQYIWDSKHYALSCQLLAMWHNWGSEKKVLIPYLIVTEEEEALSGSFYCALMTSIEIQYQLFQNYWPQSPRKIYFRLML